MVTINIKQASAFKSGANKQVGSAFKRLVHDKLKLSRRKKTSSLGHDLASPLHPLLTFEPNSVVAVRSNLPTPLLEGQVSYISTPSFFSVFIINIDKSYK